MPHPYPHPHPLALFSLVPINKRAKAVIADPLNDHLVSENECGNLVLDIGFHIRSKSRNTLATLGRGDADIFVAGSNIAKIQCSFEIDLDTNIVMLYDRSHGQTTQVLAVPGDDVKPFEYGRLRKVVVQERLNTIIGMGEGRGRVQFELKWHPVPAEMMEKVKSRENISLGCEENPRLARTIDEADTIMPSRRETRVHTPGPRQLEMRYAKLDKRRLGSGQFGEVYKVVDVDSGRLMAVKILKRPVDETRKELDRWKESVYYALKREVETLARINHVSKTL
jgi:hypothetical protein